MERVRLPGMVSAALIAGAGFLALALIAPPSVRASGPVRAPAVHWGRQSGSQQRGTRGHHRRHRRPPKLQPLAPGALDPSFGTGGVSTVAAGTWAAAAASLVQPDGKIVTAGETQIGGRYSFISTRMDPDGALDPTYGAGGVVIPNFAGGSGANAIALQPDGKIILGGAATVANHLAFAAVRLLPSGALDPSFGEEGLATVPIGAAAIANSVAVQHDGRIVLGGTVVAGHIAVAAARLDPDGSIDRSFGSAGVTILSPAAAAWGMALERNGDIAFGGETAGGLVLGSAVSLLSPELGLLPTNVVQTLTAGGIRYFAARLLPNGQPDPTFGSGGIVSLTIDATAIAFAVAATPDGRIVLAGNAFTNRLVTVAVRLLPNGRLDPTFGTDGVVSLPVWQGVNAMVLKPKGNMLIAGVGATVIELQADGRPAAAFGNDGIASPQPGSAGAANGVALSPHRIVLAGASTVNGRTVLSVMRLGQ